MKIGYVTMLYLASHVLDYPSPGATDETKPRSFMPGIVEPLAPPIISTSSERSF